jgi:hypothetical protein
LAADAVDPEAPQVLERFDGGPGARAEDAVVVNMSSGGEDGGQPTLQVADRLPAVSEAEGKDYR